MKKQLLLLVMMMTMVVSVDVLAHDIMVVNNQGKTIYYEWTNNNTELAVSYCGNYGSDAKNEYWGEVIIPESVLYNGKNYSVTSIGRSAFYECSLLTSITLPNSVTSIGQNAFSGCSGLTSVTIPNSVKSIGQEAFAGCSGLKSVIIPNGVYSIEIGTFYGCSSLTSVTIPNSVISIGQEAFLGTAWYNNQPDGIVYAGKVAYKYKGEMPANSSFFLDEGTLGIASRAFEGCNGLKSVTIPNSVKIIMEYAFNGCIELSSVTIGIGVTSIDNYAFQNCNSLESLIIPNSVKFIGYGAFKYCRGLTSINIPNSVTSIHSWAFGNCENLSSVTIPNSVTYIGENAFSYCDNLTCVKVGWTTPYYSNRDIFDSSFNYAAATLYVPSGTKDAYTAASLWRDFGTILEYSKCAMPTISVIDGKLHFECETPDAQFTCGYTFDGSTAGEDTGNDIPISSSYNVWVVAKKSGFDDSDMVTKKIDARGLQGDVNRDGKVSISDAVGVVNTILDNGGASAPAIEAPDVDKSAE